MYSFTGQNTYGNFNSTYATSPAAVFSAVHSQQTPHTPLNAVGATNPTSMYASFSNTAATAPSASGYPPAYAAPTPAAAYASYGQTAAAVAGLQQQQQLQSASNVVNVSGAYGTHNPSRLTDSFGSVGTVPSSIASYTSLTGMSSDYTSTLRSAAPAAVVNPSNNNSFVGVTRIGANSLSSNPLSHAMPSVTGATSTPSSYSGYDVGVYAAASSYLQSKSAGTTNIWMGSTKKSATVGYGNSLSANTSNVGITSVSKNQNSNRSRGQFSNKRFSGFRGSGDVQQFYCEVCKISCAGSQTYKEHVKGQKHKKKEALQKGEGQTLSKSRVSFRCETCNVTCTGKDTYESHIRGSKHQKTANLMKKLGRTVSDSPTVLAPGEKSNSATTNPSNGATNATVGGSAVSSKGTSVQDLARKGAGTTEAAGQKNAAVEAALAAEKDVQPVGEDYVEEERNASGKLMNYVCKLCDCKFSDPNAKNIHIKGRKHRLQYKLKVNPNLVVEMKPNQMPREVRSEFARKMRARGPPMLPRPFGPPHMLMMKPPLRPWYGLMDPGRRIETMEDKHVMAKHQMIYPSESRLNAIERLVVMTEKGLKEVSDHFANEDENQKEGDKESSGQTSSRDRLLKGVMRVGLLAKGLLLKDDKEVELVVLCSQPPTYSLLSKVAKLLPKYLENDGDVVTVTEEPEKSALFIKQESTDIGCYVVLTSVSIRSEVSQTTDSAESTTTASVDSKILQSSKDVLPKQPCLDALAELRHAKWFQVKCASLHSAVITLRILRDIRHRIPSWQPLSAWAAELLVGKVLESCGAPLSPGDAVRRVFEAIASGILYSTGPSLKDPCEKENVDAVSNMSNQQREDITSTSQHALRLIAFNQLYKVLDIQRLPDIRFGPSFPTDRKRPRDSNGSIGDGEVVG
uniref:DZF domain-containing protein n=1 Tax=Syphacia muris TaxID=451379 RepID=A0A158R5J6_9BILA